LNVYIKITLLSIVSQLGGSLPKEGGARKIVAEFKFRVSAAWSSWDVIISSSIPPPYYKILSLMSLFYVKIWNKQFTVDWVWVTCLKLLTNKFVIMCMI
jgi:hypothetical protein